MFTKNLSSEGMDRKWGVGPAGGSGVSDLGSSQPSIPPNPTENQPGVGPAITSVMSVVRLPIDLALRILSGVQSLLGVPSGIRLAAAGMLAVASSLACYFSPLAAEFWTIALDNGNLALGSGPGSEGSNVSMGTGDRFPMYVVQQEAGQDGKPNGDYWSYYKDKDGNDIKDRPSELQVWRGGRMIRRTTWTYHGNGKEKVKTDGYLSGGKWYETRTERNDKGQLLSETLTVTDDATSQPLYQITVEKIGGAFKVKYREWQPAVPGKPADWGPWQQTDKLYSDVKKLLHDKYSQKEQNDKPHSTAPQAEQKRALVLDGGDGPGDGDYIKNMITAVNAIISETVVQQDGDSGKPQENAPVITITFRPKPQVCAVLPKGGDGGCFWPTPQQIRELDLDKNGTPDAFEIDLDGDGLPEVLFLDGDEDGFAEAVLIDEDHDGKFDYGVLDTNGDKVYDTYWKDKDGDGWPQEDEASPLSDENAWTMVIPPSLSPGSDDESLVYNDVPAPSGPSQPSCPPPHDPQPDEEGGHMPPTAGDTSPRP